MKREYTADQIKLLQLLSKEFPTIPQVGVEAERRSFLYRQALQEACANE